MMCEMQAPHIGAKACWSYKSNMAANICGGDQSKYSVVTKFIIVSNTMQ